MTTVFKISYGSDIRRITVSSTTSFNEFNDLVKKLFIESIPEHYVIKYTDDENDLVSITCDRELAEAFSFANGKPLLRLSIIEKKAESKPAPATVPVESARPTTTPAPSMPFSVDPVVGIIEQALSCPELQGLISAFGVSSDGIKDILSGLKQPEAVPEKSDEKEKEKEKEGSTEPVHSAYCDHCDKQITGIRWKCTVCSDFDLCSACEPLPSVHDPQHLFLKITAPVSLPMRRPLLRNYYAEPACPYGRWDGMGGRGWGRRCHQWRHNQCNSTPAEGTTQPVTENRPRWQHRSHQFLSSRFIADVTINDGTQMEPRTEFNKVWRLKNTGNTDWPAGTALTFVAGDALAPKDSVVLSNPVQPNEEIDIGINMVAPEHPGRYISNFRLITPEGISFGHRVWADILVIPSPVVVEETKKEVEEPVSAPAPVEETKKEEPIPVPTPVPVAVEEKKEEPAVPLPSPSPSPLPAPVEDSYPYAEQLAALVAMGFSNVAANKAVLAKRKGDVVRAVTDLLAL